MCLTPRKKGFKLFRKPAPLGHKIVYSKHERLTKTENEPDILAKTETKTDFRQFKTELTTREK